MDDLSDGADDNKEESDNEWADKDLTPELEIRNADSDDDERPLSNNNAILETVNEEEDDSVTDWNEMATSVGMTGTGSGADLLVNNQSLRDTLLSQIESIGLVRSEENIIRNG
jgi:hypothetical protein